MSTTTPPHDTTPNAEPYGLGLTQTDMMEHDRLVLVDERDRPAGDASKRDAHAFSHTSPRGILHRAFSCFIFDEQDRMLLTRRADSKITFPGVWTNACCSHPLHGRSPDEVDTSDAPAMPGIKHAARRKLAHELGIRPDDVPHANFRYLTRFHYWAADTLTHGSASPWGEHEIDYILLLRGEIELQLNPDEVSEVRYVSRPEMRAMLADGANRWSPWFVGIMERGGWEWWEHMDEALVEGGRFYDRSIHYFDPPKEHVAEYNLPTHDRSTGVRSVPSLTS